MPVPVGIQQTPQNRAAFLEAVARVEAVVEAETELLRSNQPAKLDEFNHRKIRCLLELSRAVNGMDPGALGDDGRARLETLRSKLEGNLRVLQMHLTAVREVASLITRAIQDAESDGTYTGRLPQMGRR